MSKTAPAGALVISLDFELRWGVRDRESSNSAYAENLRGARTVVPRLLELFEEFEASATWAVVGFLLANSREELQRFSPAVRPAYRHRLLSPYEEPIGRGEGDDPLHFAPSLVREIQRTPRQEIASHTFSHFYCCEEGQSPEAFRADLAAACAIASGHGIRFRSIVFPRNQHNPEYDDILWEMGIRAYRGNPRSDIWRCDGPGQATRSWRRAGRLLDAYAPVARSTTSWEEVPQPSGLSDVRAGVFLRPYTPKLRHMEPVRLLRIRRALRRAARAGRILHLWWHPHTIGVHQEENLGFLRSVLEEFAAYRESHGMRSLSMADVDARVRGEVDPTAAVRPQKSSSGTELHEERAV